MRIVLMDLTNGATTRDGGALSPSLLAQMAEAYTIQLNVHYSAEYGGNFVVRAGAGAGDLQDGEDPFAYIASNADAPDAIAWHTVNGNGRPLLFDAITASDTVNGPGNSATVAGSHENLETARDAPTNIWRDTDTAETGAEVADEIADPFENQSYPITLSDGVTQIWVSNFALQAFFTPGAVGPYSYMAAAGLGAQDATAPFQIPTGQGYMIRRTYDPSSEQAVNGRRVEVVGSMLRRPQVAPGTRKHRRGLRP